MGGLEKQGARATGDSATGLGCPTSFLHSLIHAEMWGLREGWGLTLVLMRSTLWWGSREVKSGVRIKFGKGAVKVVWSLRRKAFAEARRLSWGWRVRCARLLGLP